MRTHLFFIALALAVSSRTRAQDYVVQVETVGFTDVDITEAPKEAVLSSIAVMAPLGSKFYGKVVLGNVAHELRGRLQRQHDGEFWMQVRFTNFVMGKVSTSIETNTLVDLRAPITIGTSRSVGETSGLQSKHEYVLTLSEYKEP